MDKVRLKVLGLSVSQTQTGAYALVLSDEREERRVPIIIGPVEAQSIAIHLEGLIPPRPLTHDLFRNMAISFDIIVREILIMKLEEGIFYSEIICERKGETIRIDSRTSDAVSLALRFNSPIFTTPEIMEKAGIIIPAEEVQPEESIREKVDLISHEQTTATGNEFESFSIDELKELLQLVIEDEDYEKASRIRDEIKKRG